MSWFTQYVEHPALNALAQLQNNPAIIANPDAQAAVAAAKQTATTIASTTTTAAQTIMASIQSLEDPAVKGLAGALQTGVDAYLLAALGPVGAPAAQFANTVITLGADKAHQLIDALFAHARGQVNLPAAAVKAA